MILRHVFDTPRLLRRKVAQGFLDLCSVPFFKGMCLYNKCGWPSRFLKRHGPVTKMDETNQAAVRVVVESIRSDCSVKG